MTSSTSPPVYLDKDGVPVRFKKRKARFTFNEVHILLDEVRKNRHIVVGKFNYGVPSTVKKRTWAEITARINEIGECEREVGEVIKKWSDMKCDTKRKVAAVRSGLKGCPPSRFLREFTPTENIIRKILELDGQQGGPRTSSSRNGTRTSAAMGPVEDEDGGGEEDDDMEMDMGGMGSMHSSPDVGDGDRGARTGALDPFSRVPPPFSAFQSVPSTSAMTTPPPPPSAGLKEESAEGDSLFDSSGDLSEYPFEMSFEIPFTEDSNQLADLEEEQANSSRLSTSTPTPTPIANGSNSSASAIAGAAHRPEASSLPGHSSIAPLPQPAVSAPSPRSRPPEQVSGVAVSQAAAMSVEEQHMSNALLETVSRSLELLAESVQQLAETQQEFMSESLRIQRDTVQVLRDFATGAMTLMHDKLNGRPAL